MEYVIKSIEKDIRILQRNKELSLKNNDNERYSAIIKELEEKSKEIDYWISLSERTKIALYNSETKRKYLYGDGKKEEIKTKYNDYYLSNFTNSLTTIKANSYLTNFK